MEEMKCSELMDKVTFSVINESVGRNENERIVSLEIDETRWPSICMPCEGNTSVRKMTVTPKMHRRGRSDDMLTRIWYANDETLLTPGRKYRKLGRSYNCERRKLIEGERE